MIPISRVHVSVKADSREVNAAGSDSRSRRAGGGGFLLLYCEQAHQQSVRQALAAHELREMRFEFESEGARIIVNDPFLDGDHSSGLQWNLVWNSMLATKGVEAHPG